MNDPDISPEAVERFDFLPAVDHMGTASMELLPSYGDWVRYSDYAALSAALEAERGWRTVAESNQQMAQSWQDRAETAEAKLKEAVNVLRAAEEYLGHGATERQQPYPLAKVRAFLGIMEKPE